MVLACGNRGDEGLGLRDGRLGEGRGWGSGGGSGRVEVEGGSAWREGETPVCSIRHQLI